MVGRWLVSRCFVGYYIQDLFIISCAIAVKLFLHALSQRPWYQDWPNYCLEKNCLLSYRIGLTYIYIYIYTNPSKWIWDTKIIFKRSLTGLNSEFPFSETSCLTKAEEPNLSYDLPIAGGRIIGFIPFPRILVLWEMRSISSSIWTRVAVSITYDDNHYTTGS